MISIVSYAWKMVSGREPGLSEDVLLRQSVSMRRLILPTEVIGGEVNPVIFKLMKDSSHY